MTRANLVRPNGTFAGPAGWRGAWLACLAVAVLIAGTLACSRNLNERTDTERAHAAQQYRLLGDNDLANGRLVSAVSNYAEAVRILPTDAASYWQLARIYEGIGFEGQAAVMATKARVHAPAEYEDRELDPVEVANPAIVAAALEPSPIPPDADYVRPPESRP